MREMVETLKVTRMADQEQMERVVVVVVLVVVGRVRGSVGVVVTVARE
jgi:hypothetical protein